MIAASVAMFVVQRVFIAGAPQGPHAIHSPLSSCSGCFIRPYSYSVSEASLPSGVRMHARRHVAGELWQLARRDATVTPQISGNIAPLFPLLCHPLPQDTMVVEISKAICPSSHSYVPSSEGAIGYLSIFRRLTLREY